jgi:hypothetical protein
MRKKSTWNFSLIFILFGILLFMGCDNKEYDRDKGPSDIRIENMTTHVFDSILVDTSEGENYYGTLDSGAKSEYKRFDVAYPKADISLFIEGVNYTYGPVDYTYAVWLGKGKFTYQLDIEDPVAHTLSIIVIADAPLD